MEYIKSESFLCVASLLEMILRDQGDKRHDRFQIANELGITIPPTQLELKKRIPKAKISSNEYEYGIMINPIQFEQLFKNYGVALNVEYIKATPFIALGNDEKDWNNAYVLFLFSYGELIHDPDLEQIGHAALYITHSADSRFFTIYDPGPDDCGEKNVKTSTLEEAMYQRRGGYLLISRKGEHL